MQKISSSEELREAIQLLEIQNDISGKVLKNQLVLAYSSLKPIYALKNTLHENSSPSILDEISGTGIGLIGGFLSKKIFVGTSGNKIRNLIGSVLQLGVTTVVAQNSGLILSLGMSLFQRFIHRPKMNPGSRAI